MVIITKNTPEGKRALGDQYYPFLERQYPEWFILTHPITDDEALEKYRNDKRVTFRHVRDDGWVDLAIKGVNTQQFLAKTGLEVSMDNGGNKLFKRWSRIMRPYQMFSFFQANEVSILYDQTLDKKVFDGAGKITRALLLRIAENLPADMKPKKRKKLVQYLTTTKRVEITVMTANGQDKGHVFVYDDLPADLVLPCDTKPEVKLTDGTVFIGIMSAKPKNYLWLDIQSLINLMPLFSLDQLIEWLRKEGKLYLDAVKSGDMDVLYERMAADPEIDVEGWHLLEYMASGGQAMWFGGIVRAIAGQFVRKIEARALDKFRTPVPGGRYYVFTAAVGNKTVERGHILLEDDCAFVNNEDWSEYIAAILGGADEDDALCVLPFKDYDSELKVIAWRNPNQLGERIVMQVQGDIPWASYPQLDSRKLTPRIDEVEYDYVLPPIPKPEIPKVPYSVAAATEYIFTARRNIGALGMYVNYQMILKAMFGKLPQQLARPLEEVIDNAVKDGGDLLPVKMWINQQAEGWIAKGYKFPQFLARRVEGMVSADLRDQIKTSHDNWLDHFGAALQTYVKEFERDRDVLVAECMPPMAVFTYGEKHIEQAAKVRAAYSLVMREAHAKNGIPQEADFAKAARATEQALMQFPEHEWKRIMAGIAIRVYVMGDESKGSNSDASMWQLGEVREGKRLPGLAQLTIEMLRQVGVLGDIDVIEGQRVTITRRTVSREVPVRVNGTWMAYTAALYPQFQTMGDVPDDVKRLMKQRIIDWAQAGKFSHEYEVRTEPQIRTRKGVTETVLRKTVWSNNNRVGYIDEAHEPRVGDKIKVVFATAADGNLALLLEDTRV